MKKTGKVICTGAKTCGAKKCPEFKPHNPFGDCYKWIGCPNHRQSKVRCVKVKSERPGLVHVADDCC